MGSLYSKVRGIQNGVSTEGFTPATDLKIHFNMGGKIFVPFRKSGALFQGGNILMEVSAAPAGSTEFTDIDNYLRALPIAVISKQQPGNPPNVGTPSTSGTLTDLADMLVKHAAGSFFTSFTSQDIESTSITPSEAKQYFIWLYEQVPMLGKGGFTLFFKPAVEEVSKDIERKSKNATVPDAEGKQVPLFKSDGVSLTKDGLLYMQHEIESRAGRNFKEMQAELGAFSGVIMQGVGQSFIKEAGAKPKETGTSLKK